MTHITCRLTAKNWDRLRNPTLCNRVWANFFYRYIWLHLVEIIVKLSICRKVVCKVIAARLWKSVANKLCLCHLVDLMWLVARCCGMTLVLKGFIVWVFLVFVLVTTGLISVTDDEDYLHKRHALLWCGFCNLMLFHCNVVLTTLFCII